jgi:hypothetical protein
LRNEPASFYKFCCDAVGLLFKLIYDFLHNVCAQCRQADIDATVSQAIIIAGVIVTGDNRWSHGTDENPGQGVIAGVNVTTHQPLFITSKKDTSENFYHQSLFHK